MLKGKDIICISSIDWDFIWQGHQEIMSVLAKNGNRVLFIENTGVRAPTVKDISRIRHRFLNWKKGFKGIRKELENLYVYSPLALPLPYSRLAIKINKMLMLSVIRRWMASMEFHNPVVWTFLPTGLALDLANALDPSIFIYYCIDDFSSSSKGARRIVKIERKVIKRADLVFTTSQKLYEKCLVLNKETYRFPFGINMDNYNRTRESPVNVPVDIRNVKHPVVGYVGGIHKWVDLGLIRKSALAFKEISFVLVGPKQVELKELEGIDNIFILGKKSIEDLPSYVKAFDAGIIPYRKTSYTDNVYPTKINEYLSMGKPVISTRIPEVVELDRENGGGFISFIDNEGDLRNIVRDIFSKSNDDATTKRINVANKNSWKSKIAAMSDLIESKLSAIQQNMSYDWLARFSRFCLKSRNRVIKPATVIILTCLVLFYTPFIWYAASPLKISDLPRKADAIVVFGGGVGETGSPGKSTIERAAYSVDLYKQGFANRIIYSSGYTYKYNDADNMRLFALSMGVANKDIILDREGNFTYENVKFVSEILRKNRFRSILLVTSPYNTRRASLVFKHIAPDINVTYVPVPDSDFFKHVIPVKTEQIGAILHEYLGIAYYFLKGYI